MKRRAFLAAGMASGLKSPQGSREWVRGPIVPNRVAGVCQPAALSGQTMDPSSYLGRRVDINYRTGLLQTFDPDEYLRGYGAKPKWPPGEYLGKFIQGLARMHVLTGDGAARDRLDRIVRGWLKIQSPDGWLGSYARFKSWDIWEHKYVLLGLLDYYALTGVEDSLAAAKRIGNLICKHLGPALGNILQSGHWALGSASILEPMVSLYRFTGESRYLHFCEYILDALEGPAGPKLLTILTKGSRRVCDVEDTWANRPAREVRFQGSGQIRNRSKGYEMLSCLIGALRMYELTGRRDCLTAAANAWKDISDNRLYLAGSSGADECFKDDHCLPAETLDGPAESCVTAHWIYLSRTLFDLTGEPRYADAVENSLYNYLLASQRPQDCHQSYNTPMNGRRSLDRYSIWDGKAPCCISSAMREIARTPESVWTKFAAGGVGVLLYCQAQMEDLIRTSLGMTRVRVEMRSRFPLEGEATIRLTPERAARFRLALRVPAWAKDYTATAGGVQYRGTPGRFLDLDREWAPGDEVQVGMDLNERFVSGGASYPGYFALMRGPQVLTLVQAGAAEGSLDAARFSAGGGVRLASAADSLPAGWVGGQAYRCAALEGAEGCLIVPFGDSCQPGVSSEFRTWIPGHAGSAAPSAPFGLQASVVSPHRIRISWKGEAGGAEGYRVERKRADIGLWFHVKTAPAGSRDCEDTAVNVVQPGKTYSYRVAAFNGGGASAYTEEVVVTVPELRAPAAPAGLRCRPVSDTRINLAWTSQSRNEEGFQVERREQEHGEWLPLAGRLPAGVTVFHDFALEPGRRYSYRVRAFNAGGASAWSNESGATTGPSPRVNASGRGRANR